MATQTGSYDFAPVADAAGKANNYITDLGDSGIRVHPLGDTDNYSAIDADGMSVVKGGTSVAHFGETARIGVESAFNTLIQAAQFAIRYATDRLFNVSTDGYSTNIYMGGSTLPTGFKYTDNQVYTIYDYLTSGCTVSGHVVLDPEGGDTSWRLSDDGYGYLHDSDGALVIGPGTGEIEYLPSTGTWEVNPSLSPQSEIPGAPVSIDMGNVGIRAADKKLTVKANRLIIQASHISEGDGTNEPSGSYSHCEGSYTTASKPFSHAEGMSTTASGNQSHAEGMGTTASGNNSHAQNLGTVAAYANQTAIGKWNDNSNTSAFEVGNGTSDTDRSNAFAVAWDGTTVHDGDVAWTALPLVDATTHTDGRTPMYRRWGQMVHLSGSASPTSQVAAQGTLHIGTLPTGVRPSREVTVLCQGSADAVWLMRVGTDGRVTAERYRNRTGYLAMSTNVWLAFDCTFVI